MCCLVLLSRLMEPLHQSVERNPCKSTLYFRKSNIEMAGRKLGCVTTDVFVRSAGSLDRILRRVQALKPAYFRQCVDANFSGSKTGGSNFTFACISE